MKKRLLLTIMVVSGILMFAACGSDDKNETTTNAEGNKESTTTEAGTEEDTTAEAKAYKLSWEAPEGFTSEDGMLYVGTDYPVDASNITYLESPNDVAGIDFTKEEYMETLQAVLGETVAITKFEELESNGCEGLLIKLEYEIQGIKMVQTQYIYMSGKDLYSVTYTVVNDSPYAAAFEDSAKTIKMVEAE